MRNWRVSSLFICGLASLLVPASLALADELGGKIRGTVSDPSGAVIAGAQVTATNVDTRTAKQVSTAPDGGYEFLQLQAPATYNLSVQQTGFKTFQAVGVHLDLNQVYVLNVMLELGQVTQQVMVEASPVQVEATSIQLGTTVSSSKIQDMPLNGRNWIQLQQLQPGVVSESDVRGNFATNGSQAGQNSYLINGNDTNEFMLNTPLLLPSPDAIAEFRMITNTINPEYGRNSGAILNAAIRSGTNDFHGDGFEFYRDTSLNTRNFFHPKPDIFHQNQFGGIVGGPVWKNHTFFFFSYQGTRSVLPEQSANCGCLPPGNVTVFSAAQRNGAFPDIQTSTNVSPFPLLGENGITYPAGTPYSTIFPTGHIPVGDFNKISAALLNKYVPSPNVGRDYQFNPTITGTDDQEITRIDHTFSTRDALWGYWLMERNPTTDALGFTGATVPGFASVDKRHYQQYTLAWNHTFGSSTLNEARFGYTRLNFVFASPQTPIDPASAGFTGIHPQLASGQSLPLIALTGFFNLGFSNNGPQPRIDQTYQVTDNFSKIVGRHTPKFGFDMRRFQIYNPFSHDNSGVFSFGGAGSFSTGDPGADFLLGIPDSYTQASGDVTDARAREYYSYAQDQYKVRPNLTLTYGMGWTVDTPINDFYHNNHGMIAFRPGQQSTVFPKAPVGYVFQGDAGVHAAGTTHYKNFGPRFGFAYSPNWGRLSGGPGKMSIRGGLGIYFNRSEEEPILEFLLSPPFGITSFGVADGSPTAPAGGTPAFADPYTGWLNNRGVIQTVSIPNKFPFGGPNPNIDFGAAGYLPLVVSTIDPHTNDPYAENFNLTVERQLPGQTIVSVGYVGALGHRLILAYELNPGINASGCAANAACVQNRVVQPVLFPNNYLYPGNIIAAVDNVATVGNSNYSSFQTSVKKHLSHGLEFLASYTWAHAMDNGSGFENAGFGGGGFGGFGNLRGINPFNRRVDYGPSIYDATHRFVFSYTYNLPSVRHFQSLEPLPSRLTDGWRISGVTTFQTGFPLDVFDSNFTSLTCSGYFFYSCADGPNLLSRPQYANPRSSSFLNTATDPTNTQAQPNYWFNPNTFARAPFGAFGNAGRNLLRGAGINNFDFALFKDIRITGEFKKIELRFEFYNLFNHTQFDPAGITTDINNGNFGLEQAARDPRLIQLAAKFYF